MFIITRSLDHFACRIEKAYKAFGNLHDVPFLFFPAMSAKWNAFKAVVLSILLYSAGTWTI